MGERGSGAFRFEWPILESTACYIQRWVLTCFILAAVAAAHHSTPCLCVFHFCSCRCCSPLNTLPVCVFHSCSCRCCSPLNTLPVFVSFLQLSLLLTVPDQAAGNAAYRFVHLDIDDVVTQVWLSNVHGCMVALCDV